MSPDLMKYDSSTNRRYIYRMRNRISYLEIAKRLGVPINYVIAVSQSAYLYCRVCGERLPCITCARNMRKGSIGKEPPASEALHCDLDPAIAEQARAIQETWSEEEERGKRAIGQREEVHPFDTNTYRIVVSDKRHAIRVL